MMTVHSICTAKGKVILIGEHAVLYGCTAIAAALPQGASAQVVKCESPNQLWLGGKVIHANRHGNLLEQAFAALLNAFPTPHLCIHATCDLPTGAGLGSSAAIGLAIARAIESTRTDEAEERALARASCWENVFHGRSSGIDLTAAASQGQLFTFHTPQTIEIIHNVSNIHICIGISHQTSSTKDMIERVANYRNNNLSFFEQHITQTQEFTTIATNALKTGDAVLLGNVMNQAHGLLQTWGVSIPQLDRLCQMALDQGALGAKLTGSGGGGCVIALTGIGPMTPEISKRNQNILEHWQQSGFGAFTTILGTP